MILVYDVSSVRQNKKKSAIFIINKQEMVKIIVLICLMKLDIRLNILRN